MQTMPTPEDAVVTRGRTEEDAAMELELAAMTGGEDLRTTPGISVLATTRWDSSSEKKKYHNLSHMVKAA